MRLVDIGCIALKASVFTKDDSVRISNPFSIRRLLVMCLARTGGTQVGDPLRLRVNNDHILVTVGLLLTTVMKRLFFRVFRPLSATLGTINDVITSRAGVAFSNGELTPIPFRLDTEI